MASVTIHVVQAFTQQDDGIVATEPKACPSAGAARALAARLAQTHVGVIAWSRTGRTGARRLAARRRARPQQYESPDEFDTSGGVE